MRAVLDVGLRPEPLDRGIVAFIEQGIEGFQHECLVMFGGCLEHERDKHRFGVGQHLEAIFPVVKGKAARPLQSTPFKASAQGEAFYQRVQELQPTNDMQRGLKDRLIQVTTDLAQGRRPRAALTTHPTIKPQFRG